MKVVTIGGAVQDICISYAPQTMTLMHDESHRESFILMQEGRKIEIKQLSYHVGGGAINSAISFARLGGNTQICSMLGKDPAAQMIIDTITQEKIDTSLFMHTDKAATGCSFIIPSSSGDRAVLVYRGANALLDSKTVHAALSAQPDWLYITSLGTACSQALPELCAQAHNQGIRVAVNPGTTQLTKNREPLKNALPYIDILILNAHEAHLLMEAEQNKAPQSASSMPQLMQENSATSSCFTVQTYFKKMIDAGVKTALVTNGKEGVYASEGKHIYFIPAINQPIVSTLGAGDAFGSTFVFAQHHGHSIEESMKRGVVNSFSVLQYANANEGLLDHNMLESRLQDYSELKTEKFSL